MGTPVDSKVKKEHFIFDCILTFQFCLLCSAGYHTFGCHSEHFYEKWLAIDLTGISIGVLGCYLPGVYYAFYCMQVSRFIGIGLLFQSDSSTSYIKFKQIIVVITNYVTKDMS